MDDIKIGDYFAFTGVGTKLHYEDIGLLQRVILVDNYRIKSVFIDSKIENYFEVGTHYHKKCVVVEHIGNDEHLHVNGIPIVWGD